MTNRTTHPTLRVPPIQEVVCGVIFRPVLALDTLHQGLFWARIRDRFPRAEIHPPIADPGTRLISSLNLQLQRSWFISDDDEIVVQMQLDRFYLNWRRRGAVYPRFDSDAKRSVLARFESELNEFKSFMIEQFGESSFEVAGTELTKVDSFRRGDCWSDLQELAELLPVLESSLPTDDCENFAFQTTRTCANELGLLRTTLRTTGSEKLPTEVIAEFSLRGGAVDDSELRQRFVLANDRVNDAFFSEVPNAEAFFGKESP